MMDKDRAIVIQVAAKIAAELTNMNQGLDDRVSEYAVLFSTVEGILLDSIFGSSAESGASSAPSVMSEVQAEEVIRSTFNASPVVAVGGGEIEIAGKQHGPLPDWLISAARRDGVSKLWDNRDGLTANPKRPWFKAVEGGKAYWPPRGK
jgi:hypothetical protein